MKRLSLVAAVAAVAAALLAAAPASAANKKKKPRPAQPAYIACTILGCHPVPRGCYPTMGYTLDGIPTGFDVIVCPRYR